MTSWKYEAQRMGELTIPATCVYFGLFTPQALTAAFVGRKLGVQYLDGFSLANLMFVLGLSVLQGLVTANDTLMPQAFGAGNYKEVGFLAVRGFAVSLLVMVPICTLLYLYMHDVLLFIRQSPAPARLAEEFFRVYVWALPFNVLYVMQWKFLAAQQIVRPLVLVQLVACGAILPLALTCLVDWFGFVGGAWALVLYNAAQAVLLLAYIVLLRPHHPSTWPGMWIVRSAFSWEPVVAYLGLGVGGIFTSLEWWFWEILTLVVGTFGPIPLSVHTIASQVLINVEMISLGIANALVVRMGATIPQSASRAQKLMIWTYAAHTLMVVVELVLMWVFRYQIFSWFTKDPLTIEVRIRTSCVCVCVFCPLCSPRAKSSWQTIFGGRCLCMPYC